MSEAAHDRAQASELPEGDVIRHLLEQHARIRELFATVKAAEGAEHKEKSFDQLRALLAVHETGEEMVLRPVSKRVAGDDVADERNHEEAEANKVLAELEKMGVDHADFDEKLAAFEKSVDAHAEAEEHAEFPAILGGVDEEERHRLGTLLVNAEKTAPTHPHPSAAGSPAAVWAVGPFASMVDHARDALHKLMN